MISSHADRNNTYVNRDNTYVNMNNTNTNKNNTNTNKNNGNINMITNNSECNNSNGVVGNNNYNTKMMLMLANRQYSSTNTDANNHFNQTQRKDEVITKTLWASKSSSRLVRQCNNCQMLFNDSHNCKLIKSNHIDK
jgi:hypothetical protein